MASIRKALSVLISLGVIALSVYAFCYFNEWRDTYASDESIEPIIGPGQETGDGAQPLLDFEHLASEYPDIKAWLTVEGTKIDYPVVQAEDNSYYLHRSPSGATMKRGSIFLDYRCQSDFSGDVSVLYGHNMADGSMFKALISFKSKKFFDSHPYGTLFTPNQNYQLEFFAVSVTPSNSEAYKFALATPAERNQYQQDLKNAAMHFKDIQLGTNDQIVILSTCSYEFEEARTILAARLSPL